MTMNDAKKRLDHLLVEKKLTPTRSQAKDLIKRGYVTVNGEVSRKAGQLCSPSATILLDDAAPAYVSRAAIKLLHAIDHFNIDCQGRIALDLGASTGGFTEVLLQKGAAHVYAVDVGHDQLHETLRSDKKVTSMEGQDARQLTRQQFHHPISAFTVDVSFISIMKLLQAPMTLASQESWLLALIKPQFEVGRVALGKKGIVKDEAATTDVIEKISNWLNSQPSWQVIGTTPSPITGQNGNREFLIYAQNS